MTWTKVANLSQLKDGVGTIVDVGDKPVALFRIGKSVFAISNTCAHRGGPLGEGDLDGAIVTCPWHGYQYDVTSGQSTSNPPAAVPKYSVKIEGDDVLVET